MTEELNWPEFFKWLLNANADYIDASPEIREFVDKIIWQIEQKVKLEKFKSLLEGVESCLVMSAQIEHDDAAQFTNEIFEMIEQVKDMLLLVK